MCSFLITSSPYPSISIEYDRLSTSQVDYVQSFIILTKLTTHLRYIDLINNQQNFTSAFSPPQAIITLLGVWLACATLRKRSIWSKNIAFFKIFFSCHFCSILFSHNILTRTLIILFVCCMLFILNFKPKI